MGRAGRGPSVSAFWPVLLLLCFVWPAASHAQSDQDAITITDQDKQIDLSEHTYVLEDPTGKFSLDDVRSPLLAAKFHKGSLRAKHRQGIFWFRVSISNDCVNIHRWKIATGLRRAEKIDLYLPSNSTALPNQSVRDSQTYFERPIPDPYIAFPVEGLANHNTSEIFLRIQPSLNSEWLKPVLFQEPAFETAIIRRDNQSYFYYGIAGGLAVFNFLLFVFIRDSTYLFYVLQVVASMFWVDTSRFGSGFLFRYVWPNDGLFDAQSPALSTATFLTLFYIFAGKFNNLSVQAPRLNALSWGLIGTSWGAIFLMAIDVAEPSQGGLGSILVFVLITLPMALGRMVWRGDRSAKLFLAAFTPYLVLMYLYFYGNLLLNLEFDWPIPPNMLGSGIEMVLMSLILADRFNQARMEKERAHAETIDALRRSEQALEATVEERTRELQLSLNDQVASANVLRVIATAQDDPDQIFQEILKGIQNLCRCDNATLWRIEGDRVSALGDTAGAPAKPSGSPPPYSPLGQLIETRDLVEIDDLREHPGYKHRYNLVVHAVEALGARTAIMVPMISNDILYGAIAVRRKVVLPFEEREIKILRNFATQAVIAIENARLFGALKDRTAELEGKNKTLLETQSQLVQAEKMASLGTLVAGVAHEINTPLGIAVTATTQVMADRDGLETAYDTNKISRNVLSDFLVSARQGLRITYANLSRAADLVSSFKQVAVDQRNEDVRVINLSAYVDDIALSLGPLTRSGGVLLVNKIPKDLTIALSPGALAQILTNLVHNSTIHAFHGIDNPQVTVSATVNDDTIRLTVTDNGVGMSNEVRGKAFDPFFTTKRGDGGGTGLGLHIVHNLVTEALKGSVEIKSTLGQGTEFSITLNRSLSV